MASSSAAESPLLPPRRTSASSFGVKLHCCLIYEILHLSRDVCAKHTLTTYRFSRSEGGAPGQRVPYQGACDVREDRGEPSVLRLPLRNLRIAIGGDRLEKIPKRQRS